MLLNCGPEIQDRVLEYCIELSTKAGTNEDTMDSSAPLGDIGKKTS
jgi:hypothetical protein